LLCTSRPAQAVIDRDTQTDIRNIHHGNGFMFAGIEKMQHGEEMPRRFFEVAFFAEVLQALAGRSFAAPPP